MLLGPSRLRLVLVRLVFIAAPCPCTVPRRRRPNFRADSSAVKDGVEASSSWAEAPEGSGLILWDEVVGSVDSSSAADWLLVRSRSESAIVEDVTLPVRPPWPLLAALAQVFLSDGPAVGVSVAAVLFRGGLPLRPFFAASFVGGSSGTGEPRALIGLTSLDRGLIGEPGVRLDPGMSTSFHLVDEVEVDVGVGRTCCSLPEAPEMGVRWSKNFGPCWL